MKEDVNRQLLQAVLDADPRAFNDAYEAGADINTTDQNGMTPLFLCVYHGHTDMMQGKMTDAHRAMFDIMTVCLPAGKRADIDKTEKEGMTPLMIAAYCGHVETVQRLLSRGARADMRCNRGRTAADYAWSSHVSRDNPENETWAKILSVLQADHIARQEQHARQVQRNRRIIAGISSAKPRGPSL